MTYIPGKEREIAPGLFVDNFKKRSLKKLGVSKTNENKHIFLLSHFHSDHYGSLNEKWNFKFVGSGWKNCRLMDKVLGVDPTYMCCLTLGVTSYPCFDGDTPKYSIIPVPSDHCEGSMMFLIGDLLKNEYILETTDFRFTSSLETQLDSIFSSYSIKEAYIDCTNTHTTKNFPDRISISNGTVDLISWILRNTNFSVYIGLYKLGKEHLQTAILNFCSQNSIRVKYLYEERLKIMKYLGTWSNYSGIISEESFENCRINFIKMRDVYDKKFCSTNCISIKPSSRCGYVPKIMKNKNGGFVLSLPYTDHSSSYELKRFLSKYLSSLKKSKVHMMFGIENKEWENIVNATSEICNMESFFQKVIGLISSESSKKKKKMKNSERIDNVLLDSRNPIYCKISKHWKR